MIVFEYGNRTDAEIKLVLSGAIFAWLVRSGRIFQLPQPCSPAQLFAFVCQHEPGWRGLMSLAGLLPDEIEALRLLSAAVAEGIV